MNNISTALFACLSALAVFVLGVIVDRVIVNRNDIVENKIDISDNHYRLRSVEEKTSEHKEDIAKIEDNNEL